ncbi:hypothetical protein N0V90_006025 [Kalmusia sp. IMI 367209]|nr:hypothetical protein N0V90_006025 [Kalmusia sp. IMI 367209]
MTIPLLKETIFRMNYEYFRRHWSQIRRKLFQNFRGRIHWKKRYARPKEVLSQIKNLNKTLKNLKKAETAWSRWIDHVTKDRSLAEVLVVTNMMIERLLREIRDRIYELYLRLSWAEGLIKLNRWFKKCGANSHTTFTIRKGAWFLLQSNFIILQVSRELAETAFRLGDCHFLSSIHGQLSGSTNLYNLREFFCVDIFKVDVCPKNLLRSLRLEILSAMVEPKKLKKTREALRALLDLDLKSNFRLKIIANSDNRLRDVVHILQSIMPIYEELRGEGMLISISYKRLLQLSTYPSGVNTEHLFVELSEMLHLPETAWVDGLSEMCISVGELSHKEQK